MRKALKHKKKPRLTERGIVLNDIEQHKIMSMEIEKRDRVINAAMKEFNKGFKKASTDVIVREAGISKGLLFHYFGNKENLYEFILKYTVDVMVKEYFELINLKQRDFLERMWQMILLKMDLSYKYPLMFDFLTKAYKEKENSKAFEINGHVLNEIVPKLFTDIDETLFKDGIDPKKAVNIIYWTQRGYADTQFKRIHSADLEDFQKEYNCFLKDIKEYFDIFRKTFYR